MKGQVVAILLLEWIRLIASSSSTDWRIVFFTGDEAWSGTDAPIFLELIGEFGNSPIIKLTPRKSQLESGNVDVFQVNMGDRHIGRVKSLIIGKQHTYAFFNDWQIDRIEVLDPYDMKYVFRCGCWLTRNNYKKMIELSSAESVLDSSSASSSSTSKKMFSTQNSRAFPLTVFLLFLLLLLVLFSYFGNSICQKWRDHALMLGGSDPNSRRRSQSDIHHQQSFRGHDHATIPLNGGLIVTSLDNATIEDKPPDYKVLFPNEQMPSLASGNTDSPDTSPIESNVVNDSSSSQSQPAGEQQQQDQTREPKILTQTSV